MTGTRGSDELLARLGGIAGLCAGCRHRRLLKSARSVFVRCGLAETDSRLPRYPPLPVIQCPGFEPVDRTPDRTGGERG